MGYLAVLGLQDILKRLSSRRLWCGCLSVRVGVVGELDAIRSEKLPLGRRVG
jgi:hypothetical protein